MATLLLFAVVFVASWVSLLADIYTIDNAPVLEFSDSIQIYYLEAPFPYNTPENIVNTAGDAYNNFATNHAGLGVWDTTTDVKFTIEFVSVNYTGALLPDLSSGKLSWKNIGSVVITNPVVQSNWLSSKLITTTIGSVYSQLITYLQDNRNLFLSYQPVTAVYVNSSAVNGTTQTNTDIYNMGNILLPNTGSYWFVDLLVTQLGTYGCDLETFLQVYASSFNYLSNDKVALQVVEWASESSPNPDVYAWYNSLTTCYHEQYDDTVAANQGAQYFLSLVKSCYGDYAYIFRTNTSVYNMTLGNYSLDYATPMIAQYIYDLPPDNSGDKEKLSALDYIMIALAGLAVLGGCAYFLYMFFGKKKRRHVSFEGERIAENIVGPLADLDHEDRAYYHGRGRKTLLERLASPFASSTPTHMKRLEARSGAISGLPEERSSV